jgi:primosomal protein N' (replication factor Y)
VQWAARYSADSPGCALAIALRGARAPKPRPERRLESTGQAPSKPTPARLKVLEAAGEPLSAAELAARAGVGAGVIKGLVEDGALRWVETLVEPSFPEPDPERPGTTLNPSQAAAGQALAALVTEGGFQAALLDGVTGSGKTEVYLEAVAAALRADPEAQVLVLLPEIALTQAVIARFTERFGASRPNGIRASARPGGGGCGRRRLPGGCGSWWAPAQPCSCPTASCA